MGAVGVGLAGVGNVAAVTGDHDDESEKRGRVTFSASAVTHDIDFPSEGARGHSLVSVNTLPEHAVFEDEGVLSYTHLTTRETARVLEKNPAGLWHENYQALPVSDAGSTQNAWIGIESNDHQRLTKGALLDAPYRPPGFNLLQRGEKVQVTAGSKRADVAPGERFTHELPTRNVRIAVSEPTRAPNDDTKDDSSAGGKKSGRNRNRGRSRSVQQLSVTPTVHVKNYGELEIRARKDWTPREPKQLPKEVPRR